jgi:II/X family phage/plasmid replication protein
VVLVCWLIWTIPSIAGRAVLSSDTPLPNAAHPSGTSNTGQFTHFGYLPHLEPVFIDWIHLSQKHDGLPDLNGGFFMETDENDSEKWRTAKHLIVEGSHDSSIKLRSFAGTVEMRGNIGRWCRSDNLFNLDFPDTIRRANEILDCFSLPAFSDDGDYWENNKGEVCSLGAQVSKLDLTRNYLTGSQHDAAAFMAWLDGQSLPYIRRGRKIGSTTVCWGSPTGRFMLIAYDKAQEMLDHAKDAEHRAEIKDSKVYKYCRENGLIRVELKLRRQELKDKGLRFLGDITMEKLTEIFNEKVAFLYKAETPDNLTLADIPKAVRLSYTSYINGVDVAQILPRETLRRHAKILRNYGVDLTTAPSVHRLKTSVRSINIQPAIAPDWYWAKAA